MERLRPLGRIKVGSDEYIAHTSQGFIEKGSKVVIEEIRGTSIYARETNGSNTGGQPTALRPAADA